jgi:MFS family permease
MHIPLKTNLTSKEFHVSVGVMTLGTRLTVLIGYVFPWMKPKPHINIDTKVFTVGPLIWGPMSELYGRLKPLYVGYAIFIVFQVPVAVAQNIESSMLGHFRHLGPGNHPWCSGRLLGSSRPQDSYLFSAATFVGLISGLIM